MTENVREGLRGAGDRLRAVGSDERVKGVGKVLQGFKDFVSRGNAIELAVGVVIGAAFTSIVAAIQEGLLSPLIGWVFGKPNLERVWDIGPYSWRDGPDIAPIQMGLVLNALLQFLLTAAAIYFLVVLPLNALAARRKRGEEAEPAAPSEDVLLLQEIRDLLAAQASPAVADDATPGAAPAAGTGPGTGTPGTGAAGSVPPPGPGRDVPPSIPPGTGRG